MESVGQFGNTATKLSRSPLGIIALFIVLIYGVAALVVGFSGNSLDTAQRWPLIWFLVLFPLLVLLVFTWLVCRHHTKLYAPADFRDESIFLKAMGVDTVRNSIESEIEEQFKQNPPKSIDEAKSIATDVAAQSISVYDYLRSFPLTENQRDLLREFATPEGRKGPVSLRKLRKKYSMYDIQNLSRFLIINDDNVALAHKFIAEWVERDFSH
jgi:hypothetical protein